MCDMQAGHTCSARDCSLGDKAGRSGLLTAGLLEAAGHRTWPCSDMVTKSTCGGSQQVPLAVHWLATQGQCARAACSAGSNAGCPGSYSESLAVLPELAHAGVAHASQGFQVCGLACPPLLSNEWCPGTSNSSCGAYAAVGMAAQTHCSADLAVPLVPMLLIFTPAAGM